MDYSKKFLSLGFLILVFGLVWSLLTLRTYIEKNEISQSELKKMKKKLDSLDNEIFVLELKLFRYERAVEIFDKRNPSDSSQLSDIIADETE